jgi:FkbM family methyltransferase
MTTLPYIQTTRTRFINILRRFLRHPIPEHLLIYLSNYTPFARKLIPPEYLYPENSFRTFIRDGITYRVDLSDVIGHALYFFNRYFVPLQLFKLIREDSVVLDIGANIGTVALRAAGIATRGRVYAFEPGAINYAALRQNIALNKLKNIVAINKALGAVAGQSRLFTVNRFNAGMNRILSSDDDFKDFEVVRVGTLDEEVRQLGLERIDLIKIDVEGYELNVLNGARNVLERFQPMVVVEVIDVNLRANGHCAAELTGFLTALGYHFIDLKSGAPLRPGQQIETDVLCYTSRSAHWVLH